MIKSSLLRLSCLMGGLVACGPAIGVEDGGGEGSGGGSVDGGSDDATTADHATGTGEGGGGTSTGGDAGNETGADDDRTEDGTQGDIDPSWSRACIEGWGDEPIDFELAKNLYGRLQHELTHSVEVLQTFAATMSEGETLPWSWDGIPQDHGFMTISGTVTATTATDYTATLETQFSCYSGGHGGWGPVGLDGIVHVTIEGDRSDPSTFELDVGGPMRLGGGGALIGSPPADVNYVYSRELGTTAVEQGAIGPHPVEDFSP